jgi:hypothetical protein
VERVGGEQPRDPELDEGPLAQQRGGLGLRHGKGSGVDKGPDRAWGSPPSPCGLRRASFVASRASARLPAVAAQHSLARIDSRVAQVIEGAFWQMPYPKVS